MTDVERLQDAINNPDDYIFRRKDGSLCSIATATKATPIDYARNIVFGVKAKAQGVSCGTSLDGVEAIPTKSKIAPKKQLLDNALNKLGTDKYKAQKGKIVPKNQDLSKVKPVNGRNPINHEWAGQNYPVDVLEENLRIRGGGELSPKNQEIIDFVRQNYPDGVNYTPEGFPDFSPYSNINFVVEGGFIDRTSDFSKANSWYKNKFNKDMDATKYTWHHHEDGKTLVLIDKLLHDGYKHTGGIAKIN